MLLHVYFVLFSLGLPIFMNVEVVLSLSKEESVALEDDEHKSETREICLNEVFEAKCLKNEVIVMNSAIYGRMRMGRCLQDPGLHTAFGKDPRFFGCSVDILSFMDSKCSGRNQCEVRGTDIGFQQESPCYADLKTYMEASYECLTVIDSERSCTVTASSSAVHIMQSSSTNLGCGTRSQPWILHAPTGQQVQVSLLDFSGTTKDVEESPSRTLVCHQQLGYIMDKSAKKNVSICRLNYDRKKVIYKSSSNFNELVLSNETSLQRTDEHPKYLIGFIATGCSDMIPPEEAWLRRNNTEATVGCYTSRRTWHLHCLGNQWIGVIGNCTQDLPEVGSANVYQPVSSTTNPYTVIIIVAIGCVALIICAVVICSGFVCLKRHYANTAQKYCHQLDESTKYHGHGSTNKQMSKMPILVQNEA